ncbi:hypothetical protein MNBD_NITROSPINAE05-1092 [hydrothermal vent metagenome]|uniref:Uncharacterized protein n=1 Tax=hydrothermal vent metagenome TaxID=652676 RepID=A0A3B1CSA2_9ZZZZ
MAIFFLPVILADTAGVMGLRYPVRWWRRTQETPALAGGIYCRMNKVKNPLEINLYPPDVQVEGAFDSGRITETKPIGFSHEGLRVPHLGLLFYWALSHPERLRQDRASPS